MTEQEMVEKFMLACGQIVRDRPGMMSAEERVLRYSLIREELDEFVMACRADDLTGAVDAVCDLLFVVYGTACSLGVNIKPCFAEVFRSNMTKIENGMAWLAPDGKVMKSPNYEAPNLEPIIAAQLEAARGNRND